VGEKESLPRAVLYTHYREFCERHGLPVWNIANYGRLLRHCFPSVVVRRLGHRQQSKYYFEGIVVRPDSDLSHRDDVRATLRSGERSVGLTRGGSPCAPADTLTVGPARRWRWSASASRARPATSVGRSRLDGRAASAKTEPVDPAQWPLPTMLTSALMLQVLQGLRTQWLATFELPVASYGKVAYQESDRCVLPAEPLSAMALGGGWDRRARWW
jgi:hypothetical protein